MTYTKYKCPRCGGVHAAIPLQEAQEQVQSANAWLASNNEPETEDLARYMRCSRCGAPLTDSVPAQPDDAPDGCTIQPVVVLGVWP